MSALEVFVPADGLIAVVKRDCPTCELTESVLAQLSAKGGLTVFTQDDPAFPESVANRIDDSALNVSHTLGIEIVANVSGAQFFPRCWAAASLRCVCRWAQR